MLKGKRSLAVWMELAQGKQNELMGQFADEWVGEQVKGREGGEKLVTEIKRQAIDIESLISKVLELENVTHGSKTGILWEWYQFSDHCIGTIATMCVSPVRDFPNFYAGALADGIVLERKLRQELSDNGQ